MVTVIATGFNKKANYGMNEDFHETEKNTDHSGYYREQTGNKGRITTLPSHDDLSQFDIPAHKRREVNLNDDLGETIRKPKILIEDEDFGFGDLNDDEFSKPAFLRRQMD